MLTVLLLLMPALLLEKECAGKHKIVSVLNSQGAEVFSVFISGSTKEPITWERRRVIALELIL